MPRWGVYRLRAKPERLGTVEARDQGEALERALEQFGVFNPSRISVQLEG